MEIPIEFDIRNLVIGMGQIGTAIAKVLDKKVTVFTRDLKEAPISQVDILHICFPYSDSFVEAVRGYIEEYNPRLVIVYSTVPVGTCEKISKQVVHSPIEGKHPQLARSITLAPRWIGCADPVSLETALHFWSPFVKVVKTIGSSKYTEFLKLRSTAKYGVNLVWADYEAKVSSLLGMNFGAVKDYDQDYNEMYMALGMPQYQRYILTPPDGKIGGHCIIPNAEILDEQFPHTMLKQIKRMKRA